MSNKYRLKKNAGKHYAHGHRYVGGDVIRLTEEEAEKIKDKLESIPASATEQPTPPPEAPIVEKAAEPEEEVEPTPEPNDAPQDDSPRYQLVAAVGSADDAGNQLWNVIDTEQDKLLNSAPLSREEAESLLSHT